MASLAEFLTICSERKITITAKHLSRKFKEETKSKYGNKTKIGDVHSIIECRVVKDLEDLQSLFYYRLRKFLRGNAFATTSDFYQQEYSDVNNLLKQLEEKKIKRKPKLTIIVTSEAEDKSFILKRYKEILDKHFSTTSEVNKLITSERLNLEILKPEQESTTDVSNAEVKIIEAKTVKSFKSIIESRFENIFPFFNSQPDYDMAITLIADYFDGKTFSTTQHQVSTKPKSIGKIANALADVYHVIKPDSKFTFEYLDYSKKTFEIFKHYTIDPNNITTSVLFKEFTRGARKKKVKEVR